MSVKIGMLNGIDGCFGLMLAKLMCIGIRVEQNYSNQLPKSWLCQGGTKNVWDISLNASLIIYTSFIYP